MPDRTCSIDGCSAPWFCRGWCSKHYSRWQRHGDPLTISRTPPIEPGAEEKWCPRCEWMLPVAEFKWRSSRKSLHGYCSPCMADYDRVYRTTARGLARKRRAGRHHMRRKRAGIASRRPDLSLAAHLPEGVPSEDRNEP